MVSYYFDQSIIGPQSGAVADRERKEISLVYKHWATWSVGYVVNRPAVVPKSTTLCDLERPLGIRCFKMHVLFSEPTMKI